MKGRKINASLVPANCSVVTLVDNSSPGDSSIGMNIPEAELAGCGVRSDDLRDVNETAALVLDAKKKGGKSGLVIRTGGSPKNFMLQTEPQIQEVVKIKEEGDDSFLIRRKQTTCISRRNTR